nr:hypothetical protein [Actinoplanes sp. N902-109]
MIKIEPQRGGDEERYRDERRDSEHISPGERAPPPGLGHRLGIPTRRCAISGYDRDRRGGNIAFQSDQLGVQVFGGGTAIGRQNVPARRLACRVNTRNRHSIGEPIRGW